MFCLRKRLLVVFVIAFSYVGVVFPMKTSDTMEFSEHVKKILKDIVQSSEINVKIGDKKDTSLKKIGVELQNGNSSDVLKKMLDILYIRLCVMLTTICDQEASAYDGDVECFDEFISELFEREKTIIEKLQSSRVGLKVIDLLRCFDLYSDIKSPQFNYNNFVIVLKLREQLLLRFLTMNEKMVIMSEKSSVNTKNVNTERLKVTIEKLKKTRFFSMDSVNSSESEYFSTDDLLINELDFVSGASKRDLKKRGDLSGENIEFLKSGEMKELLNGIVIQIDQAKKIKRELKKNYELFGAMCKDFCNLSTGYMDIYFVVIRSLLEIAPNFKDFIPHISRLKSLMGLFTMKSIQTCESKIELLLLYNSFERLLNFTICSENQKKSIVECKKNGERFFGANKYTKKTTTSFSEYCLSKKEYDEIGVLCKKYPESYTYLFDLEPFKYFTKGAAFISTCPFDDAFVETISSCASFFLLRIMSLIKERYDVLSNKNTCNTCDESDTIFKKKENCPNDFIETNPVLKNFKKEEKKREENRKICEKKKLEKKKRKQELCDQFLHLSLEPAEEKSITTNTTHMSQFNTVPQNLNERLHQLSNTFLVHAYLEKSFLDNSSLIKLEWGPGFYHCASCLVKADSEKEIKTKKEKSVPLIDFALLYDRYLDEKINFENDAFHYASIAFFKYHLKLARKYSCDGLMGEQWFLNFCKLEDLHMNDLNNRDVFVIEGYLFTNVFLYNQLRNQYPKTINVFDIIADWSRFRGVWHGRFVLIVDKNNNATHACFHREKEESMFKKIKK